MKLLSYLGVSSLAALSSVCAGQGRMPDRVYPVSYMTQEHPAGVTPNVKFASMLHIQVHATGQYTTPIAAAERIAFEARTDLAAGHITPDTICVWLHGFGHDDQGSEPGHPNPYVPELGFFIPAIDSLPGITSASFPNPPDPPTVALPYDPDDEPRPHARPWRHPYLVNASNASPTRAWFQEFVNKLDAIHDDGPNPLPHPSTWRFYMDVEPRFYFPGDINGVFIPRWLALTDSSNHIWSTWPVPGSLDWQPPSAFPLPANETIHGETLAQLYAKAVSAYGLPANPLLAFDTGVRADHIDNRPAMIWWYHLTQMAADATMKNIAWDVLKNKWPGVRYGNWDMSRYDGQIDTTSWYVDWDQSPPGTTPIWSDEFPRCFIDPTPSYGGAPYSRHNVQSTGYHDRWVGMVQRNSANTDSPIIYPLSAGQDDGNIGSGGHGHEQMNWYTSYVESDAETTLRLLRHNVESIINSGSGHNQTRLSPWVAQFAGYLDPFAFYAGEEKVRRIIAMLRAKNVNELLQWSGTAWTDHAVAWGHTEHVVKRVYLATVSNVKAVVGELPAGSWEHEPSMLEYTLRDEDGLDYTADVQPDGTSNQLLVTVLEVELTGFENLPPMPTFNAGQSCGYSYEINLEGRTKQGVNGIVQAWWNYHDGTTDYSGWHNVADYYVYTPDGTFRKSLLFQEFLPGSYVDGDGRMTLRLVQTDPTPLPVTSMMTRYDLLQVIPAVQCSDGLCCTGEDSDESDMNYDGQSNSEDMDLFMSAWVEERPAADLNLDDSVDAADVSRFLNEYAGVP